MKYVLIFLAYNGTGWTLTTQEFENRAACDFAKAVIERPMADMPSRLNVHLYCAPMKQE